MRPTCSPARRRSSSCTSTASRPPAWRSRWCAATPATAPPRKRSARPTARTAPSPSPSRSRAATGWKRLPRTATPACRRPASARWYTGRPRKSCREKHLSVGTTPPAAAAGLASLGGQTMGTSWSARVAVRASTDLHALHAIVQGALDEVVAQMSTWEADSDISRYRRAAAGSWQALPEAFARVLEAALDVARASGGAFDPTVAPLVELWGFGAGGRPPRVPPPQLLAETRARTGWQRLQRRAGGRELLQPGGLALDFSAIAKGFGADLAAERLRAGGVAAALVEVGGEIRAYGRKPDGNAWQVLVEAEPDLETPVAQLPPRVLALEDAAV